MIIDKIDFFLRLRPTSVIKSGENFYINSGGNNSLVSYGERKMMCLFILYTANRASEHGLHTLGCLFMTNLCDVIIINI